MATYQEDWRRIFYGVIMKSKLGEHHAWCVICSRDVNVSSSSSNDVKTHIKSKLRERNAHKIGTATRADEGNLQGKNGEHPRIYHDCRGFFMCGMVCIRFRMVRSTGGTCVRSARSKDGILDMQ